MNVFHDRDSVHIFFQKNFFKIFEKIIIFIRYRGIEELIEESKYNTRLNKLFRDLRDSILTLPTGG